MAHVTAMTFEGQQCYVVAYGTLTLVALVPFTAQDVDRAGPDDELWEHLGLRIDPRDFAHDCDAIARTIRLFMSFETAVTGVEWDLDANLLASRIYLSDQAVIVPLWREL